MELTEDRGNLSGTGYRCWQQSTREGPRTNTKLAVPASYIEITIRPLNCLVAGLAPVSPIRQVRGSREIAYCKQGIGATNGEGY